MNWYVLFVRGGMEEKIRDFFLSQGLHAFIPKMKVVFRKQGISELVEKIMFPGYLSLKASWNRRRWMNRLKNCGCRKRESSSC